VASTIAGYWFLDRASDSGWTPPVELERFIQAGEKPIYIGFGSMVGRNPARLGRIILAALDQAGLRAVIATGWGGLALEELPPDSVLQIGEAPHDWLFPRMRAVVHHGGAGTTAAGLRAGKPTLVCPFLLDQPFWGQRVHTLGVGPKPLPQKKLSVAKLTTALRSITTDTDMRTRAEALADRIAIENGVEKGVSAIETIAHRFEGRIISS
jgi:sterol 3beta-glucosyltransferase